MILFWRFFAPASHVVVERRERAVGGVAQHLFEPPLRFAGEERDVEGVGELIRLNADDTHQTAAIDGVNAPANLLDRHDDVGFIINLYVDFNIVAEDPAIYRIEN